MKAPKRKPADLEAGKLIESLIGASKRDKWRYSFRASAMPSCQLQQMWFTFDEKLGEEPGRKRGFMMEFFMDVGTAVHATTQRWLGRLGVLFGDWACENVWCEQSRNLDKEGEVIPVIRARFGPQKCPDCKKACVYSEFKFEDSPTGHCDGLIKLGKITPEEMDFILLEIKTASLKRIEEFKQNGIPFPYKLQGTIYTKKLRDRGYNVLGVMFLFIPRDNPRNMWPFMFKPKNVDTIHDNLVEDHDTAKKAIGTNDYSALSPACATLEDAGDCPYRVNCFSPSAQKIFIDKHLRYTEHPERDAFHVKGPTWPKGDENV